MTHFILEYIITLQVKDTMNLQQATEIFLKNYFVLDYCSYDDLVEAYGVPVNKIKAFEKYFERTSVGDETNEILIDVVNNFKNDINFDIDEDDEEEETTKEDTNVAEQSMKLYLENFVSNSLPDEEIKDNGVPENKVSALKKYVVDELIARLEDHMLKNEIDHIIKNEDEEEDLFEKFRDEEEEDDDSDTDENSCEICYCGINIPEDDFTRCDKCDFLCCTDCYIYRPDIFGMKEMEDKNGDCWRNCEVCITCDQEFENADEEEQKEIIKAMKIKHDEPDTDEE